MGIETEVIIFFTSCLLGAFFSFYYDCFRILRKIISHHGILVFFEDIFYFASSSIIMFSFISEQTYGEIRGFLFVGVILGFVLYFFTIGMIFMKVINILFLLFNKVFLILYNIIIKVSLIIIIPIKLVIIIFHYFFTKIMVFLSIITKTCKKIKIKQNLT